MEKRFILKRSSVYKLIPNSQSIPIFVNKLYWNTAMLVVCTLSVSAFALWQQRQIVTTETVDPQSLKDLVSSPLQKICQLLPENAVVTALNEPPDKTWTRSPKKTKGQVARASLNFIRWTVWAVCLCLLIYICVINVYLCSRIWPQTCFYLQPNNAIMKALLTFTHLRFFFWHLAVRNEWTWPSLTVKLAQVNFQRKAVSFWHLLPGSLAPPPAKAPSGIIIPPFTVVVSTSPSEHGFHEGQKSSVSFPSIPKCLSHLSGLRHVCRKGKYR